MLSIWTLIFLYTAADRTLSGEYNNIAPIPQKPKSPKKIISKPEDESNSRLQFGVNVLAHMESGLIFDRPAIREKRKEMFRKFDKMHKAENLEAHRKEMLAKLEMLHDDGFKDMDDLINDKAMKEGKDFTPKDIRELAKFISEKEKYLSDLENQKNEMHERMPDANFDRDKEAKESRNLNDSQSSLLEKSHGNRSWGDIASEMEVGKQDTAVSEDGHNDNETKIENKKGRKGGRGGEEDSKEETAGSKEVLRNKNNVAAVEDKGKIEKADSSRQMSEESNGMGNSKGNKESKLVEENREENKRPRDKDMIDTETEQGRKGKVNEDGNDNGLREERAKVMDIGDSKAKKDSFEDKALLKDSEQVTGHQGNGSRVREAGEESIEEDSIETAGSKDIKGEDGQELSETRDSNKNEDRKDIQDSKESNENKDSSEEKGRKDNKDNEEIKEKKDSNKDRDRQSNIGNQSSKDIEENEDIKKANSRDSSVVNGRKDNKDNEESKEKKDSNKDRGRPRNIGNQSSKDIEENEDIKKANSRDSNVDKGRKDNKDNEESKEKKDSNKDRDRQSNIGNQSSKDIEENEDIKKANSRDSNVDKGRRDNKDNEESNGKKDSNEDKGRQKNIISKGSKYNKKNKDIMDNEDKKESSEIKDSKRKKQIEEKLFSWKGIHRSWKDIKDSINSRNKQETVDSRLKKSNKQTKDSRGQGRNVGRSQNNKGYGKTGGEKRKRNWLGMRKFMPANKHNKNKGRIGDIYEEDQRRENFYVKAANIKKGR